MNYSDPLTLLVEQTERIIANSQAFSSTLPNEEAASASEALAQESISAGSCTTPLEKLSRYLSALESYSVAVAGASVRSSRRCKTAGPLQPLRIAYNSAFLLPETSIWERPLKKLEDVLVKSYHKLVSYNPELKESIEPVLKESELLRHKAEEDSRTLAEFLGRGLDTLNGILDHAYGLVEVTKELQEIQSEQINFRKDSYETYTAIKDLLNNPVPAGRGGRKRTYVRVFMADPENDNLPLQTVFHLIADIKRNQAMIKDMEDTKRQVLRQQERARALNDLLATHHMLAEDAQATPEDPLLDLYSKVLLLVKSSLAGPLPSGWEGLAQLLEGVLVKSFHKLLPESPKLKEQIQGVLSTKPTVPPDELLLVFSSQLRLLDEIIEHSFSLDSIKDALQAIVDSQLALQRASGAVLDELSGLVQDPGLVKSPSKSSFINIIYADSKSDDLHLETIFSLLADIALNIETLQTFEDKKNALTKQVQLSVGGGNK